MSRAPHEDINVLEPGIGTYPPPSARTQAIHKEPDFVDGSGAMFSKYMELATEEDKKMAESWTADADGILVFAGLFSAAVASMISISIQDIRPNPQDTSNFYLANIYYQTVAGPNPPNISSSIPPSPPPFSPPNYAVWVNALWFMSLIISISCALLATLLQQWARRYLTVTQPRYSLHKRAKIRTFFFDGVTTGRQPLQFGRLPTLLLHISLFLFFAGLIVFVWNVNLTIFKLVLSWVSCCMALYGLATWMPVIRRNSPLHTPFSPLAWSLSLALFRRVSFFSARLDLPQFEPIQKILSQGMQKTAEETALSSPEIDARALMLMFDSLDEDHELEHFFSSLPGFRNSSEVHDPLPDLNLWKKKRLSMALIGFFDRTFSSDMLPKSDKNRRAIICAKALDPAQFPYAFWDILRKVMSEDQHREPQATEIVRVMRSWADDGDRETTLLVQSTFTSLIVRAQRQDDSWFISAAIELGIPEADLRDYAAHGDSLSFAALVHLTGQQFSLIENPSWPTDVFEDVLQEASAFNVQDTSPNLQHAFCTLWNQIVLKAQNDNDERMASRILRPIRNIYIALHQDTDSAPTHFSASTPSDYWILSDPSSYPQCNVTGHIYNDSPSRTLAHTVPHDNAAPVLAPRASLDVPSSSVPAPPHSVESLMNILPLDNFHPRPAHQTTSQVDPTTSQDPTTANAHVISGIIIPHPTSTTSTSAPTFSPTVTTIQHNPDLLAPSGSPNHPPSASHTSLDNTPPTGLPLSSHSPMSQSDPSPSFTNCHRSAIVPPTPSDSIGPTSVPDLRAAAKNEGSTKPGSCKEEDAFGSPSVGRTIQANTMTLDLPPQSQLPLSDTGSAVAVAGPSLRAEHTGDHPSHPSCFRYDIV